MKKLLIKIGTNIVTKSDLHLNYEKIENITQQIKKIKDEYTVIVVTSGAVASGREYNFFHDEPDPLIRRQMLASIGQGKLFQVYFQYFSQYNMQAAQVLLTKELFFKRNSYIQLKNIFEKLLHKNIIPIVNENDFISNEENTFGDNDQLAALLSALLNVDLLLILSNIEGLYTDEPQKHNSQFLRSVDAITPTIISYCKKTISKGGSGGMFSKIKAIEIANQYNIPAILCNGKYHDCITQAFGKEYYGTYFHPQKNTHQNLRQIWMKHAAKLEGNITIDDGAVLALKQGKNLLAVGIQKIEGNFHKGSVITIQNKDKIKIAVGIPRYEAQILKEKIETTQHKNIIAVHSDNLYFLH